LEPTALESGVVISSYWIPQLVLATLQAMKRERGYPGAKNGAGVYQAIIAQMPPHDTYIETHLGSGAIMLRKPPAARSFGIDINASTVAAFDCGGHPDVELIVGDAAGTVADFDYAGSRRTLIYADPPYLRGKGEVRGERKLYDVEYTRADHVRLIEALRAAPAAVMISGYPSSLYDDLLGDWRTMEFQAMTRGGVRTEKLWMSFPAGQVQWASFAGRNRTERQQVKRMAARWRAKYQALDPAKRLAILAALMEEEGAAA
jgi:DNA adenine methylase